MIYRLMKRKLAPALLLSIFSTALHAQCSATGSNSCGGSNICVQNPEEVTSLILPFNDGYGLRYNFHKYSDYISCDNCWCGISFELDAMYRFEKSYHHAPEKIATTLFQYDPLTFQGSHFIPAPSPLGDATGPFRDPQALWAENFGLGRETNASLFLKPQIMYNIIDFNLELKFDQWMDGLYLQVNVPVENAKFQFKGCTETGAVGTSLTKGFLTSEYNNGVDGDPISDFFATPAPASSLTPTKTLAAALDGAVVTDSDMQARTYGLINLANCNSCSSSCTSSCGTNNANTSSNTGSSGNNNCSGSCGGSGSGCTSKWGVADVHMQLGWDAFRRESSHVGLYAKVVAPTGTHINAGWEENVFSPVIGNGRHWEAGIGFNAHADIWSCDDRTVSLAFDGYLTHMFASNTFRYFDLAGKPMSRYALAKAFTTNDAGDLVYADALYAVADLTAQCIDVSIPVKGEFVLDLMFKWPCWRAELGYSFSGQQAEQAHCTGLTLNQQGEGYSYGLLGAAGVQAPCANDTALTDSEDAWCTYYVEPGATAYNATINEANDTTTLYDSAGDPIELPNGNIAVIAGVPVTSSHVLTADDINLNSGLVGQMIINRVFGVIEYEWENCRWQPTLGILGSVGFSPLSSYTPETWDVGIRFGINY